MWRIQPHYTAHSRKKEEWGCMMFVHSFNQNSLCHKNDCDVVKWVDMHPSTHCDSPWYFDCGVLHSLWSHVHRDWLNQHNLLCVFFLIATCIEQNINIHEKYLCINEVYGHAKFCSVTITEVVFDYLVF